MSNAHDTILSNTVSTRNSLKTDFLAKIGPQNHPFTNMNSLGKFLYDNYICNPVNILFLPWHILKFLWYITIYNIYSKLDKKIRDYIDSIGSKIINSFKEYKSQIIIISVIIAVTVVLQLADHQGSLDNTF